MADTNTTDVAIEARGLAKRYGAHAALAGIDLRIERGSCYALLGPNGAGKTTTVHILTTLIAPTQGRARIDGLDVDADTRAVRERLGIVFQESCLDPALTVREHLDLSARLYHVRGKHHRSRRVAELLGEFGLEALADRPTRNLSGGERRRLEIARALLHEPQLLFLDEPTVGLDVAVRGALWSRLATLRAERGTTLFLTTHSMEEAEALASQVGILDRGEMVASGAPDDLKAGLGGDRVFLRLEREAEAIAALEVLVGVREVRPDPEGLCVQVDAAPRRLAALVAAAEPFGIVEVEFGRPTLEEVYLDATGRRFRVDADDPDTRAGDTGRRPTS